MTLKCYVHHMTHFCWPMLGQSFPFEPPSLKTLLYFSVFQIMNPPFPKEEAKSFCSRFYQKDSVVQEFDRELSNPREPCVWGIELQEGRMFDESISPWMTMAVLLMSNLGRPRCCAMGPEVRLGIDFGSGAQYVSLLPPGNYLILFTNSLFCFY